jgi:hypothetical protein
MGTKNEGPAMPLTHYTLDNFVAQRLSQLTECGAKEIEDEPNWGGAYVLSNVTGVMAADDNKVRAYKMNFFRRADGAISSYRAARLHLLEYLSRPDALSRYFRALLNLEISVSQLYQGMIIVATASNKQLFDKSDGSKEERLNKIYNTSKHMHERIEKGQMPEKATTAVWITNSGLECIDAALSFGELEELLVWTRETAHQASGAA